MLELCSHQDIIEGQDKFIGEETLQELFNFKLTLNELKVSDEFTKYKAQNRLFLS